MRMVIFEFTHCNLHHPWHTTKRNKHRNRTKGQRRTIQKIRTKASWGFIT
ncbi:hypothetical protein PAHAL_1G371400 [Panicum hallii]|uniref:Uncharacterized protein n=1 Tax=Panicum hallii TaxID=206008 RepID=A0A2T8KXG4_9POAL|nr:hypothetical protein PAHAL_1G371400 [Panicum hallii]